MVRGYKETKNAIGLVKTFLEKYKPNLPLTVGISGGADSTALAIILSKTVGKENVQLLMVNHLTLDKSTLQQIAENIEKLELSSKPLKVETIKNKESALAACSVLKPSKTLKVETIKNKAKKQNETELRSFRFEVFKRSTNEIFLAQTKNDQAEQVILGLIRGSGTRSLSGMKEKQFLKSNNNKFTVNHDLMVSSNSNNKQNFLPSENKGYFGNLNSSCKQEGEANHRENGLTVFRPFILNITRKQTEAICEENDYPIYRDTMESKRGEVRFNLIPELKKFNPKIIDNLVKTSKILGEQQTLISVQTKKLIEKATLNKSDFTIELDIKTLEKHDVVIRKNLYITLLRELTNFEDLDFKESHIEQIDNLVTNYNGQKELNLPRVCVIRNKTILRFEVC